MEERFLYIEAFVEIDQDGFFKILKNLLINDIKDSGKDYILKVDEGEYKSYLFSKYYMEPLEIFFDSLEVEEAPMDQRTFVEKHNQVLTNPHQFIFNLKLQFSGNENIFKIKPSKFIVGEKTLLRVNNQEKTVSVLMTFEGTDPKIFDREKQRILKKAFSNIENANSDAARWNSELTDFIGQNFKKIKGGYLIENKFFEEIKLRVNPATALIFVPAVKKIEIPKPTKIFSSEPALNDEIYQDILKMIYTAGKSMERKPSLYENRDEESLRDLFVFLLETRYEATSATGETFNKSGKTDIILKYQDGTNLFVAECKIWSGVSDYLDAISQLFDRYLTWRDSKVALIMFVKIKGMQSVTENIRTNTLNHSYFIKENGGHGETSFSYIFRLPQDEKKHVKLEVIAFHYFS